MLNYLGDTASNHNTFICYVELSRSGDQDIKLNGDTGSAYQINDEDWSGQNLKLKYPCTS